jgi:sulfur-oxidizing protein SoxY
VTIPKRLHNFNKLILLIENNPIQQVISLKPYRSIEAIGMNVRLEDDSPIRVAILDNDGNWNIGSKMVFVASAGGCSTPACDPAIEVCEPGIVGKIAVKEYEREAGAQRIKLKITHPMETGFVVDTEGEIIPEYFIKNIHVDDIDGPIADITTFAALSSDPVLLLDLPEKGQSVRVHVMDSHGLEFFSYKKDISM